MNSINSSEPSLFKVFLEASRPKTLPAGASPVILASAFTFKHPNFSYSIAFFTLVTTLLLQISSNLINDYLDGIKVDTEERLGRRVTSGLISPSKMKIMCLLLLDSANLLYSTDYKWWHSYINCWAH